MESVEERAAAPSAVLVLIGLPAAGKSTLACLLLEHHERSLLHATGLPKLLHSSEPHMQRQPLRPCMHATELPVRLQEPGQ